MLTAGGANFPTAEFFDLSIAGNRFATSHLFQRLFRDADDSRHVTRVKAKRHPKSVVPEPFPLAGALAGCSPDPDQQSVSARPAFGFNVGTVLLDLVAIRRLTKPCETISLNGECVQIGQWQFFQTALRKMEDLGLGIRDTPLGNGDQGPPGIPHRTAARRQPREVVVKQRSAYRPLRWQSQKPPTLFVPLTFIGAQGKLMPGRFSSVDNRHFRPAVHRQQQEPKKGELHAGRIIKRRQRAMRHISADDCIVRQNVRSSVDIRSAPSSPSSSPRPADIRPLHSIRPIPGVDTPSSNSASRSPKISPS